MRVQMGRRVSTRGKHARLSRRRVLGWLAAAPGLISARASSGQGAFRDLDKAMWVWKDRILQPEDLEQFASAYNIGTLFLYTTPTAAEALLGNDHLARESLTALRSRGRRIYAMAGEPDWALGPNSVPEHLDLLVRLQRLSSRLFDGIHLDVEPNAAEGWNEPTGKPALIDGTLRFYELARQHAPDITIDAAVNPIFAKLPTNAGDNFMTALSRRVSSVSIMAYRNRVASTLAWAAPAAKALPAGKPWRLGVEVDANDPEPNPSWDRHSRSDFESAMLDLDRQVRRQFPPGGYTGLVFQSFEGLRALIQM
jgi:hypothetical protein